MLGLAYAHGLMWARTGELRETAIAFLGISDWKFVGPIFIGDTIFVNYRIAELRDSKSKPTQAIATFDVEVVDQDERVVQRGRKALLVSKVPLAAVEASTRRAGELMTRMQSLTAIAPTRRGVPIAHPPRLARPSARTPTSRSWR